MSKADFRRPTGQKKKVKTYNIDDVNKQILAKPVRVHPEAEHLGCNGKYRGEDVAIYESKRREFLEAVEKRRALNRAALLNGRDKLDASASDIPESGTDAFEVNTCTADSFTRLWQNARRLDESNESGLLVRRRTLRKIHEDDAGYLEACCLEPWFKRRLRLSKFIQAARTTILKNRLLKNLEKLKRLDKEAVGELEKRHRKCENVAYAYIFEKYIT